MENIRTAKQGKSQAKSTNRGNVLARDGLHGDIRKIEALVKLPSKTDHKGGL
jgi:hypothetical protein